MSAVAPPRGARRCPLCGDAEADLIRPLRYALFDDLGVSGASPLVSCRGCGMVYNDVCGGREALNRYYAGNAHYLAAATAGTGGSSREELSRYRRLLDRVRGELTPDCTILDVGCGKGGLLAYLAQHGYRELWGIEPSQACRDAAGGAATIVADPRELPAGLRPDLIVASHVLEHLHDPADALHELAQIAADDAIFYVETPNADILADIPSPWSELYFEHINHFDGDLLAALVRTVGLTVVAQGEHSFLPAAGDPAECLYLLCLNRRPTDANSPSRVVSDLGDRLASALPPAPLADDEAAALACRPGGLALWGVSQYAMLILGCHPEITARIVALHDASAAKQGRSVAGVPIDDPSRIAHLTAADLLLLPRSPYTDAMVAQLPALGFRGPYRIL